MKFYEHLDEFEKYLSHYLDGIGKNVPFSLCSAIKYGILDGGKRLRPMLVFAAGEAVGGNYKNLFAVATALEMIHSYSLIHDDLPCMDNDEMRRGKPTCHKAFGYGAAVLAGDALLNLAFEILSENPEKLNEKVMLQIIGAISQASGCRGMIAGQSLDISGATTDIEGLHNLKTGALIVSALVSGALASGAEKAEINYLTEYGKRLGLAFQITDDILDATGTVEAIGKDINQDDNKTTYVTLYGIEGAKEKARIEINAAKVMAKSFKKPEILIELADYVLFRNK